MCALSPPAFLPSSFLPAAQPMENIALVRYFPGPSRFQFPSAHKAQHNSLELWDYIPGTAQGCVQSVCTTMAPDQLQLNPVLLILTALKTLADTMQAKSLHPNPPPKNSQLQ